VIVIARAQFPTWKRQSGLSLIKATDLIQKPPVAITMKSIHIAAKRATRKCSPLANRRRL
jgi:hypothetical protein